MQDILEIGEWIDDPHLILHILTYSMMMQDKCEFNFGSLLDAKMSNNEIKQTYKLNFLFESLVNENKCDDESFSFIFYEGGDINGKWEGREIF